MDYSNKGVSIIRLALTALIMSLTAVCFFSHGTAHSSVIREKGETYIVDRTGERWNVTQAKSIGFRPERFQYGIGRNAFIPLDDSHLSRDADNISPNLRIIGVTESSVAQAYSIPKLSRHEIANAEIGENKIAVGY